ncbi:MAG TPA: hypothetical protein VHE13_11635 [Opitutus sp.]|nr:hypothetical protein [Opitutus sp.]
MNTNFSVMAAVVGLALAAAGCANVESRVQSHRAAFDSWPAEVQQKVRAGRISLGFTPEMVRVALGEPGQVRTRTTEEGQAEVWVYYNGGPHFSLGLGVGAGTRHSAYAGGVGVGEGYREEELLRVIFEDGKVSAIESAK